MNKKQVRKVTLLCIAVFLIVTAMFFTYKFGIPNIKKAFSDEVGVEIKPIEAFKGMDEEFLKHLDWYYGKVDLDFYNIGDGSEFELYSEIWKDGKLIKKGGGLIVFEKEFYLDTLCFTLKEKNKEEYVLSFVDGTSMSSFSPEIHETLQGESYDMTWQEALSEKTFIKPGERAYIWGLFKNKNGILKMQDSIEAYRDYADWCFLIRLGVNEVNENEGEKVNE